MANPDLRVEARAALQAVCEAYLTGRISAREYLEERFDQGLAWLWAPDGCGGRGISDVDQGSIENELYEAGCPDPRDANLMGFAAAGPALIEHGNDEQRSRWLRSMFSGAETWCQMFSEPSAGSDLSAMRTLATRCDGGWLVTGLKSWISGAAEAGWGLLLARTEDAGLTAFVLDMRDTRVRVTPVRQITGAYGFAEVVIDGAFIPDAQVLGGVGGGFRVLLTATGAERQAFVGRTGWDTSLLLEEWRALPEDLKHGALRSEIVKVWSADFLQRVRRAGGVRAASIALRGSEEALLGKVRQTRINQKVSELRVGMSGADAMLVGENGYEVAEGSIMRRSESPSASLLSGRGDTIAGGGTELLLNMIAERVLGLPGEKAAQTRGAASQSRSSAS
jgi:alkylation response protein AidB-like acyl-CoA dehydrogenase